MDLDPLKFGLGELFQAERVFKWFGISRGDFDKIVSAHTGHGTTSAQEVARRTRQLAHLANLVATALGYDSNKALRWFQASNPLLGDISPMSMIKSGRLDRLEMWIDSTLSGYQEFPDKPPGS